MTAEKDGDVAYTGSDWNEGISGWEFGVGYDLLESTPLLRGTIFADRGVYRLGEEVHFKAILRHNAPDGIHMLPAGTPVFITVRDAQNKVVDERTVRVYHLEQRRVDVDTAGHRLARPLHRCARSSRATARSRQPTLETPERMQYGDGDDYRSYRKSVRSFIPGCGVSPPRLPRRRDT